MTSSVNVQQKRGMYVLCVLAQRSFSPALPRAGRPLHGSRRPRREPRSALDSSLYIRRTKYARRGTPLTVHTAAAARR